MVFDAHSDLFYDVTRRRLAGETHVLDRRHLDRLRRGGIEGLVLAYWYGTGSKNEAFWKEIPNMDAASARLHVMQDCAQAELAECPWLTLVRTAQEAGAAKNAGNIYAFLCIEGMEGVQTLEEIDRLAESGVRIAMLTWNEENQFAAGAGQDPEKGLTELGRQAVRRLEDRGILLDASHLSDGSFWDMMKMVRGPVIASHSNSRALCGARRNLTDEQLRAIRDTGGVVGLNVTPSFISEDPEKQTAETLALHAAHIADVIGVERVGCGFDFCEFIGPGNEGAKGLEDCRCIPSFFDCLERLGMNARERQMVAAENFLRVLA